MREEERRELLVSLLRRADILVAIHAERCNVLCTDVANLALLHVHSEPVRREGGGR